MPHYKNGDEAKVGDRVLFPADKYDAENKVWTQPRREGTVFSITKGAASCNAMVAYPHFEVFCSGTADEVRVLKLVTGHVTLGDCEKCD